MGKPGRHGNDFNPVTAGLVERPEDWPWSSYRDYLEPSELSLVSTQWPLSLFGPDQPSAIAAFRSFVLQGLEDALDPLPFSDSHTPCAIVERPVGERSERPGLDGIAADVAAGGGVDPAALLGPCRIRSVCAARKLFAAQAASAGYTITELARALGVSTTAVSRMLINGR